MIRRDGEAETDIRSLSIPCRSSAFEVSGSGINVVVN
jgi:hypothetical protein